ncbi:MAG: hypothetical protein ACNA7V_10245 [Bacteroidales bacterium]
MKKFVATISTLLFSFCLMAQPPQGFKYQAVVRDAAGEIAANQTVIFRLSIRQGSASGTIVYRETQQLVTNAFGLANLIVGSGTPSIGSFLGINWRDGQKYLQIETNLTGSYVTMGTAELMSVPFAMYSGSDWLKSGGNLYYDGEKVGIGTATPVAELHIHRDNAMTNSQLWIKQSGTGDATIGLSLGDGYDWAIGMDQSDDKKFKIGRSFSVSNNTAMTIDYYTRKVGIGTTMPQALLDVHFNLNNYNYLGYSAKWGNYFHHYEDEANGDGQTALYAYRNRNIRNDGTGYGINSSNTAIVGYSVWGDNYSFAVAGYNYNDYERSGGIIGSYILASYWGSLGYKNSSGTIYGGYFTSSGSGTGKDAQANIGIGMGAWGELFGADIHGKIYGTFTEGENYALYANGKMFKNDLDVHLQKTGNQNTVLYTNVSTNATIQTSGYATLVNGKSTIVFDEAFANAVSKSEPVVVTATPTGNSNGVYLSQVSSGSFTVIENNNGKSNVTISYIAIGKRAGYENPVLPKEVVDPEYLNSLSRGLHNDNDTGTNGEGLYYENGELIVGKHPSVLPDPNKSLENSDEYHPNNSLINKENNGKTSPGKIMQSEFKLETEPVGPSLENGVLINETMKKT